MTAVFIIGRIHIYYDRRSGLILTVSICFAVLCVAEETKHKQRHLSVTAYLSIYAHINDLFSQ